MSDDKDKQEHNDKATNALTNSPQTMGNSSNALPSPPKNKGGRPPGSLNAKTHMANAFKAKKIDPNKMLMDLLTSKDISDEKKLDSLIKVAPYIWTKLPTEVNGNVNERKELVIKVERVDTQTSMSASRQTELESFLGISQPSIIEGEIIEEKNITSASEDDDEYEG